MGDFSNPSKKPRLDKFDKDQDSDDEENLELWGHINFTAEELDLLEERATQEAARQANQAAARQANQAANQQVIQDVRQDRVQNSIGHASCFGLITSGGKENEKAVLDKLKIEQYALEGKNKALSDLLEKTVKDLNEERLKREHIIDLKLAKFKQTEIDLHQEIDKLNTTLLFKEQELRAERNKIHTLEDKLTQKTNEAQLHANNVSSSSTSAKKSTTKKSPKKLPNWCSFDYRNKPDTADSEIQTEIHRYRRFSLPLQAPRGEPRETDAVCKLLSCRVVDSCCESDPVHDGEGNINPMDEIFKRARDHASMSVTTLRCNGESDHILRPYEVVLQDYVSRVKAERSSLKLATEKVCVFSEGLSHSNLNQQNSIVGCLQSLTRLLFLWCPKANSRYSKELYNKSENKGNLEVYTVSSLPLFNGDEEKVVVAQNRNYSLLELLLMLANPTTYPDNCERRCEIEWALSALLAWSSHSKESLESCTQDLQFHSLVSGSQGMECSYLTLKLMSSLIGLTSFKGALAHHSDSWCIMCSIGSLCERIHGNYSGGGVGHFMNVIENFLFGVFCSYGFVMIKKESCPCSSQLLQGIVTMLSRQLGSSQDSLLCDVSVIRKGVLLLWFMAAHLPDFRARRSSVEQKYISLICELSRLCQTNPEFKAIQDEVEALWDFRDQIAECDTEKTDST